MPMTMTDRAGLRQSCGVGWSGDEAHGAGGGGGMVAQRVGDGDPPPATEQAEHGVAPRGQRLGATAVPDLAAVLAEGAVADVVDAILARPVPAPQRCEVGRRARGACWRRSPRRSARRCPEGPAGRGGAPARRLAKGGEELRAARRSRWRTASRPWPLVRGGTRSATVSRGASGGGGVNQSVLAAPSSGWCCWTTIREWPPWARMVRAISRWVSKASIVTTVPCNSCRANKIGRAHV